MTSRHMKVKPEIKQQYGFYVDTSKCTGCKTCQVSCKDRSDLPVGVNFRRVYEYGGGVWRKDAETGVVSQDVFAYYTSISCNHCTKPACVEACITYAMHKRAEDGLVVVDTSQCIGCEACAQACPYDAPQMDHAKGHMTKCDGCFDRVAKGLKPTCVESCPMRALDYGLMEELQAKYPEATRPDIAPLPSSDYTQPNLLIAKNRLHQPTGSKRGDVLNYAEV